MGKKKAEVPIAVRDLIIQRWIGDENCKMSDRQVSANLKIPKTTVHDTIQRLKTTGYVENRKGREPKPILTKGEKGRVVRLVKVNPLYSAPIIGCGEKHNGKESRTTHDQKDFE